MKICHYPDWRRGNPYQRLLAESLRSRNLDVSIQDYAPFPFPLLRSALKLKADVVHIHWINELAAPILWSKTALAASAKLAALALDIMLLRALGKKVVWTIHNLLSHESGNAALELRVRRLLARTASHLIIHSESALAQLERHYRMPLSNKASIVPHGNYDGCYACGDADKHRLAQALGLTGQHTAILFFGAIRRYKGIDRLLRAFSRTHAPDHRLIVAGNPHDASIRQEVEQAAAFDPRIRTRLGFVPDDEVAALFALADIAVIPFERTLTSGSAILALTLGCPLLLPAEARILDVADDTCALFYEDESALHRLLQGLTKAELRPKRLAARVAAENLSWARVAQLTEAVYRASS